MWIVLIVICIIVIIVLTLNVSDTKTPKIDSRTEQEKEIDFQEAWDRWNKEHRKILSLKEQYIEKYGEYNMCVRYKGGMFYIFEQPEIIILTDEIIPFNKVLGYNLIDNQTSIQGNTTSITTTSTKSMLGRAIVGGVLTGGVGAVIGAATAKKNTITTPSEKQTIRHDYKVYLNLNDLSNPTKIIDIGEDSDKAYSISNALNIIVERNRQK